MAGKLITLPLRVSLRSAQMVTRAASEVAGRVLAIPGHAIHAASSARSGGAAPDPAPPAPRTRAPRFREEGVERLDPEAAPPATPPAAPPVEPRAGEPRAGRAKAPDEPAHVSEEPVLVREAADPGAEEGAGAGITVIEPWSGYGRMNARDLIDRVPTASAAELAAMRLYEARHRSRPSVLAAVDRQLKLAGGGRPA
jgi:hypothetical protein